MNLDELKNSGYIIYECVSGSISYGTNTKDSDVDIRGLYRLPKESYLSLTDPPQQIGDEKNDTTFYSLKRFFELAITANPNIIELLYIPDDCVRYCSPIMKEIIDNRSLFISKKAYYTHSSYAFAQCKRATGTNKWINNPKTELPPDKMDFCWIIPVSHYYNSFERDEIVGQLALENITQPFRPIPLKESGYDLSYFHCAGLEHVENTYRLYRYGEESKGIFRGKNQQLVVESIPFEDEWKRFAGIMIYNENAYNSAHRDWGNYWTWKKERNEARYRSQEAGEINYDSKNLLHTFRLLYSGKNILVNGEPIVRFSGEKLQFLKDIRAGKFSYDYLIKLAEEEMKEMESLKESSTIPHSVDVKKINKLYEKVANS